MSVVMPLSQRPALALAAVVLLGWAVGPVPGGYTPSAVALATIATGLAVAACVRRADEWTLPPATGLTVLRRTALLLLVLGVYRFFLEQDWPAVLVSGVGLVLLLVLSVRPVAGGAPLPTLAVAAGLLLGGYAVLVTDQAYPLRPAMAGVVRGAAVVVFLLQVLLVGDLLKPGRWFGVRLCSLFAAGAVLRAGAVLAAPEPIIDVYTALDEAPRHLLAGRNPYTAEYSDPYASALARQHEIRPPPYSLAYPFYPPGPFLVALPFRAAGLDVRFANVGCDLLAAVVLWRAGRRRDRLLGAALAGVYLNLPRVPFLMEGAWYEPMLAALLGGGLLLLDVNRRAGFLLLGLGVTAKQFGAVLLLPLAAAWRRQWRWLVAGVGLGLLLALPFVLSGPPAFWDRVVVQHLRRPAMPSLTVHTAAERLLGAAPPRLAALAVAAVLIGWLAVRAPAAGTALGLWLGAGLLIFVLCHTQGYINYFYLAQYLLLLGAAGLAAAEPGPPSGLRGPQTGA